MLTLGLALASVLSFAGPNETDAAIIVVPAPAPAPAPAPTPEWGPSANVVVSRSAPALPPAPPPPPTPPRPPMRGIGLYVGSATAFAIGLTARLSQVDSATNICSDWRGAGFNSLTRCFDYFDSPSFDSQDVFIGAAYGSSIVMSVMASGALGRYKAWQTVFGDRRLRNPVSRWTFGGIFTGLGVSSIVIHFALVYTDARNPCTSWECNVERRALWIAASDGGALLLNAGLGLLSWGSHYDVNVDRYRVQWAVLPGAGPGGSGVSTTLRF